MWKLWTDSLVFFIVTFLYIAVIKTILHQSPDMKYAADTNTTKWMQPKNATDSFTGLLHAGPMGVEGQGCPPKGG